MLRRHLQLICTGLAALAFLPAAACKYSVRDTGFVDLDQPPWRVQLSGFTETQRQPWDQAAPGRLAESNLRLDPAPRRDDLPRIPDSAPPTSRSVALVDPAGRSLPLAFDRAVPESPADLAGFLERVLLSPVRDQLHQDLLQQFAVLLLIEGTDRAATADAQRAAEAAIRAFTPLLPTLPKPFTRPAKLLTLALPQLDAERILVWSLGLEPQAVAEPRLAVLYGRGRRIGPPLEGPLITRTSLQQRLSLVGQDCECDLDRSWLQGPVFPARWDSPRQESAARLLGFDPENPLVRSEVSRIVFRTATPGAQPRTRPSVTDPLALGYHEESADAPESDATEDTDAGTNQPAAPLPTPSSTPPEAPPANAPHGPWWLLGTAAGVALAAGLLLFGKILRAR